MSDIYLLVDIDIYYCICSSACVVDCTLDPRLSAVGSLWRLVCPLFAAEKVSQEHFCLIVFLASSLSIPHSGSSQPRRSVSRSLSPSLLALWASLSFSLASQYFPLALPARPLTSCPSIQSLLWENIFIPIIYPRSILLFHISSLSIPFLYYNSFFHPLCTLARSARDEKFRCGRVCRVRI